MTKNKTLTSGTMLNSTHELLELPYGVVIEDAAGYRYEVIGTDDYREYLNYMTGEVDEGHNLEFPVEFIG